MKKRCTNPKCEKPLKDTSEFHRDSRTKEGFRSKCKICHSKIAKLYRQNNQEVIKKVRMRYLHANKEKIIKRLRVYRQNNKVDIATRIKKCYDNKPEVYTAIRAKRRAAKLERTVLWADHWGIKQYYIMVHKLTKLYGMEFQVDHKIPLQGKNVSGFHVENNLQIITAAENAAKCNRFEPIFGLA